MKSLLVYILVLLCSVCIFVFSLIAYIGDAVSLVGVTATVNEINTDFFDNDDGSQMRLIYLKVSFVVDGVEYNTELDYDGEAVEVGDEISIFYNKRDPNKVKQSKQGLDVVIISSVISVILLGVGILVIKHVKNTVSMVKHSFNEARSLFKKEYDDYI